MRVEFYSIITRPHEWVSKKSAAISTSVSKEEDKNHYDRPWPGVVIWFFRLRNESANGGRLLRYPRVGEA